ncbi:MAG: biotin synthase BioB [Candidatus Aureabacteria bacterium]|nr:biotin synthase BioB [Candidatus Auribacterota bacterium]
MDQAIIKAFEKAKREEPLSRTEALAVARSTPSELLRAAGNVREIFIGNTVSLCAIVNARSGVCGEDCVFCAQSARYKTGIAVYPLLAGSEIIVRARKAVELKSRRFGIVTSGRSLSAGEMNAVCDAARAVRDQVGISPCVSLGELTYDNAVMLRDSGISRYHHNLECSERFFPSLCTTHRWSDRVRTVSAAKEAGLEVCSGGIFGIGETWADRVDLALRVRDLDVDSVPLNFLTPVQGTPCEGQPLLAAEEALKIIALFRLILPRKEIRIAGGRMQVLKREQRRMFSAGASALMVGDYLTTQGNKPEDDLRMIKELGLEIV